MSYNWLTQYNSPNYTPANRVQATWGRPRTIEAIAIHWWGDPNTNPSFEGVVNYLCRANGSSSAHIVATGTGRRVACIVNLSDASWATNSANPYTISIECDPRCRDEDYDVIAEVIAQLRQVYGNLPLVPHKQFVATACPGNYDLGRLNREAANKVAKPEWDWGHVENKVVTQPVPAAVKLPTPLMFKVNIDKAEVWDLDTNPNYKSTKTLGRGDEFRAFAYIDFNNTRYYQTEYSFGKNKTGVNKNDLAPIDTVVVKEEQQTQSVAFTRETKEDNTIPKGETQIKQQGKDGVRTVVYEVTYTNGAETKRVVKSDKVTTQPVTEITLVGTYEKPSNDGFNENDRNTLNSIKQLLEWLTKAFKAIFNVKDY